PRPRRGPADARVLHRRQPDPRRHRAAARPRTLRPPPAPGRGLRLPDARRRIHPSRPGRGRSRPRARHHLPRPHHHRIDGRLRCLPAPRENPGRAQHPPRGRVRSRTGRRPRRRAARLRHLPRRPGRHRTSGHPAVTAERERRTPVPFDAATAHTLHTDHGPLHYYRAGTSGPAVVLLHGAMLDTAPLTWGRTLAALRDTCRLFAPDLPRHGGSRPWHGPTDQEGLEAVLATLLDHWELPRATVVGLSLGGAIAAGFAARHPERVDRLVLIAPGGMEGRRVAQGTTYLLLRAPLLLRLTTALFARAPRLLRATLAASLVDGARNPDFAEITALAEAEARATHASGERILDDWH